MPALIGAGWFIVRWTLVGGAGLLGINFLKAGTNTIKWAISGFGIYAAAKYFKVI